MRGQIHQLELVYPPISNQEAEWVKNHKEVQAQLNYSNLYFIAQRPEAFYKFDLSVVENFEKERRIYFTFTCGSKLDRGYIDVNQLLQSEKHPLDSPMEIELGPKLIRIWLGEIETGEVIDWFTTEKILFDKNRAIEWVYGLENYRDFFTYNLHYVGISKKGNSLKRLVIKPHDKRLRILSNEHPLNDGSRVTDEIIFFFFRVKSLEIMQYLEDKDFDRLGETELDDYIRIIADAEKAFVKIMNAQYNEVKFDDYPYSIDGLYHSSVDRHSFLIDEDIKFITDSTNIRGCRRRKYSPHWNPDFIAVSKTSVELIKSNM